jgi:hypothetical protein
MLKRWSIALTLLVLGLSVQAQKTTPADSLIMLDKDLFAGDTTIDYDELFQDFEAFMDSILTPRSYFMPSLSVSRGYFSFLNKDNELLETTPKIMYTPMLTYYHKSGLGIAGTGYIVNDEQNMNLYQFSFTPSYDYLENHDLATGISYTRYFTKDSLPFYTSPLKNDLYAYFTYRKWWMKPMVAVSYGWGSRSDYEEREELIQSLRLRPRGYTYINTTESVSDFSVLASVRHDFYWLDVLTYNDHIRFTPQINFTSGTQKFGFNQKSSTYGTTVLNPVNVLYSSENIYLDDQLDFQPLSLTLYIRGEYSIGKFFIQPQFMLDYYFPATSNNFSTLFSVNMGLVF